MNKKFRRNMRGSVGNRFNQRNIAFAKQRAMLAKQLSCGAKMIERLSNEPSKFIGQTLKITEGQFKGESFTVIGWLVHTHFSPWYEMKGDKLAIEYALRAGKEGLPKDDNCFYGKIGTIEKIMHASQLAEFNADEKDKNKKGDRGDQNEYSDSERSS